MAHVLRQSLGWVERNNRKQDVFLQAEIACRKNPPAHDSHKM